LSPNEIEFFRSTRLFLRRAIRVHELPAARNKSGTTAISGALSFSKTFILDAFARGGLFAPPNFPFSQCLAFCYLLLNCARKEITNIQCMRPQFIARRGAALFAVGRRVDNGVPPLLLCGRSAGCSLF
jgi:hypothetical protein